MASRILIAGALRAVCLILALSPRAGCGVSSESSDDYLQTVWTTEDGLPQNSVNAIVQTQDGYLWLATFGGLAQFDGARFTTVDTANTPGMKSNRILSLCEGRDGTLWMGTESGAVISYREHVAKTYTLSDGLLGAIVWAVKEDRTGALWIGTSNGLARLQDGKLTVYSTNNGLPDNRIWAIDVDQANSVWLATSGGLVRLKDGQFTTFLPRGGMPIGGFFVSLCKRQESGYWISTENGVAGFHDGSFVWHPNIPGSPALQIRKLMEDRKGTLWISGFSPAVTTRFADGKYSRYRLKTDPAMVRAMYQDREGNLWMGSDGGGLVELRRRRLKTYTMEDGLPSDSVRSVTDDGAGGFWISTAAGLAHWHGGKFTNYTDRDGMLSYAVTALCRGRDGSLWIGSNYGLTQFHNGRFVNYSPKQGLSNPNVHAIMEDSGGGLWVGTEGGLNRLRDGKFEIWRRSDGLASDDVRFIMQAADGALWLGTTGGLSRFKDGVFTTYTTRDGLSNDYVRAIVSGPDGGLWLGTYGGGLDFFHGGLFTPVTTAQGLFDDFISRIIEDGRGNFWLLGNRGIARVSRQQLADLVDGRLHFITSVSYGAADGMKSSEGNGGNQPAGWRGADGKLWFPTIKGVVVLDPNRINELPPPVVIDLATLDGRRVATDQVVRIGRGNEDLEIHYTGLSFSRIEQVKFKFQLAGLDQDWVDAGSRRTAYYSHLPPGDYTFRVIADNGDGVWNREGAVLRIFVARPYWQAWWFLALCLAAGGAIVAFAVHYRVSQLKRAQAAQQAFSRQLIDSQENERKRIAAELHDSLGQRLIIIKNRALLLLQARASASTLADSQREQIEAISADVSEAVHEVKEISYNLRPYRLDRLGLAAALRGMIETAAAASSIAFSAEIDNIDDVFPKPAEINFYRVIQECVNNVLKHSNAAQASVCIRRTPARLTATVRDDGSGFAPDSASSDSQGFGLTGISERTQLLGGKASIHSTPGHGTTVTIEIDLEV